MCFLIKVQCQFENQMVPSSIPSLRDAASIACSRDWNRSAVLDGLLADWSSLIEYRWL